MNIKFILAFALVLTPFFSMKINAQNVEPDSVPPKVDVIYVGSCQQIATSGLSLQACIDAYFSHYNKPYNDSGFHYDIENSHSITYESDAYTAITVVGSAKYDDPTPSNPDNIATNSYSHNVFWVNELESESRSCAPDDYPNYIYSVDDDGDGLTDRCVKDNPALDKCPSGNYEFKIGGECVPVKCEASGSQGSIWASGKTYGSTAKAGTYCDGSCAHTVTGGQNPEGYTGNVAISAIATGDSCGQGTDFWLNEGDTNECQSVDVGTGTNFMTCPAGNTETPPEEPPVDLEPEEYVLQEMEELTPIEETCGTGDPSCEIRNLKQKLETENLEGKKLDIELHNKGIEAQTKTSNEIIKAIAKSADRNSQGFKSVSDAVKGKDATGSGGGGGGDSDEGFCDTEGNCTTSIDTKTEPSEGLEGFWESEYENGLQGVMDEKLIDIQASEFYGFLDQFNPSLGAGSAPSYDMCFNIGALGNFGCHNFNIDPRTFPAIKIFILVTAGFLCRRILFGG